MRNVYLVAALVIAFTTAASAQTVVVNPSRQSVVPAAAPEAQVSLGVHMFMPGPNDGSPESLKAQENARRMIYDLTAHECAILRDQVASECRLESVNVNLQSQPARQFGAQQGVEGFTVNGNVIFRIVPK